MPTGVYVRTKKWTLPRKPLAERFWQKVEKRRADECWPWLGGADKHGYGRIDRGGRGHRSNSALAHRISWELHNGPIQDGFFVCHRCDNPSCCNPNHLFLGTQFDNMGDAAAKGRVKRGKAHHAAKLTEAQVRTIRESDFSGVYLAKELGVNTSVISEIRAGKAWRHV